LTTWESIGTMPWAYGYAVSSPRTSNVARGSYVYTNEDLTHRTSLSLTRDMAASLKAISERCKDEGGRYMDRSQILRALILALAKQEDQVDWRGIKDEKELVKRIIRAFSGK